MLWLYQGALPTSEIYAKCEQIALERNNGALNVFTGIVRAEMGQNGKIEALSFDIYKPLLQKWFDTWQERAKAHDVYICMAHSIGDVMTHKSSYMCATISPHRTQSLEVYRTFIEDFKANAPIWKYDVMNSQRIYAKERSKPLPGSGILSPNIP